MSDTLYASKSAAYERDFQTAKVEERSELDVIKARLCEVHNFVCTQGERIDQITAKLSGGGSIDGPPSKPQPMPSGTLAQMNECLDAIMTRLHRTDGTVSRLAGAI
jgi:hypothetical protein